MKREAPPEGHFGETSAGGKVSGDSAMTSAARHPKHRLRPRCPYCGERVTVHADAVGVSDETYVEDCPVCCRPWTVRVTRVGSEVEVALGREDD